MVSGIRLPAAKLPGGKENRRIIRNGKITSAASAMRKACAASTRQRWLLSRTMAMRGAYLASLTGFITGDLREAHLHQRDGGDHREDHRRDRRGQPELLARVLERD